MVEEKQQAGDFLIKLLGLIDAQAIQTESHLEQLVRVRPPQEIAIQGMLGGTNPTLLELLEYDVTEVDDHPKRKVIVGTIGYLPDYVLQPGGRPLAVLDLKAPDVSLDSERAAQQICTYCWEMKAPLGLLFNGHELRVFVNARYKGLTQYEKTFLVEPVAVADRHRLGPMVELLSRLTKTALVDNAVPTARTLAKKRLREIGDRERQKKLRNKLRDLLSNPPHIVLTTLANVDGIWDGIEPKPSDAELIGAWTAITESASVAESSGRSINAELRRKVGEICSTKGWDFLRSKQIKGLRCREEGGNGYIRLPPGAGVLNHLFIQGVPAEDAKRIIRELDDLMERQ